MIKFSNQDGKKRRGIIVKCKFCNKDFTTRKDQPHTFCSKVCVSKQKSKDNSVELQCAWCNNKFIVRKSRTNKKNKSGLFFCNRFCKDSAQKLGGIKEIMPPHYGTSNGKYSYRDLFNTEEFVCRRCNYKEFINSVVIHHINENRDNNNKENLIPLCMCCHHALHQKLWKLEDITGDVPT
jgi:hypothetical protein